MEPLFLPVLHSFENNNIFTGSFGALRFRVTPSIVMLNQKEVNFDESSMKCECWHGEYCYEKSQMEDEKVFPLSEPGTAGTGPAGAQKTDRKGLYLPHPPRRPPRNRPARPAVNARCPLPGMTGRAKMQKK